ncbi:MAG: hypothetical protein KQI62_03620 [Deltaproteobacteria bacterium]|nr:hypothetical protein [Deltaproteobacteria bacterium]
MLVEYAEFGREFHGAEDMNHLLERIPVRLNANEQGGLRVARPLSIHRVVPQMLEAIR